MLAASFYDLDNTLVPGSSLYFLARGLYARDFYRLRDLARFAWQQCAYRVAGTEREQGVATARDAALGFVRGRSRAELRELGAEVAAERIVPRVYPVMAELIADCRAAGEPTYLVTAAPVELAELVAAALGMTGALGTVAEVDSEGCYTGRLTVPILHGQAKADALAAFAASAGIDMDASAAYSDSANDLPLLELVGRPHAVNPDRGLRREASARGWPVVELRAKRRALMVGVPSVVGGSLAMAGAAGVARRVGWTTVVRQATGLVPRMGVRR